MPVPMSLRALLAAVLLFACSTAVAAPAPPAARNLLGNPGFEKTMPGADWMPADWDSSDAGLSTVFFGRDTFLVHSGHYAVSIANTSVLFSMAHNWSQALVVGRSAWGRTAVFSIWTRSNGLQGRAFVWVQAYRDTISKMALIWGVSRDDAEDRLGIVAVNDPLLNLGWKCTQFDDAQSGWVRREARAYVPPGTNVLFVRCGLYGSGQVLFDDASLTLEPSPPAPVFARGRNLFTDPGFENGALDWEWAIPPFEGAHVERDSTVAHGGRFSMACSNLRDGAAASRAGMAQVLSARGLEGKRLRLTGWIKGDSLISSAYAQLFVHTPDQASRSGGGLMLSNTFDWTKVSAELDVPADACLIWPWLQVDVPCSGRVWIDDAELTVIGDASRPAPPRKPLPPAAKPAPATPKRH